MKINNQQLINLPVVTEAGHQLGVVESFNVDIESQSILEYTIKPSSLIAELINGEFIISRGQIVTITQNKIIVDNNISKTDPFKKFNKLFTQTPTSSTGFDKKKSVVLNKE